MVSENKSFSVTLRIALFILFNPVVESSDAQPSHFLAVIACFQQDLQRATSFYRNAYQFQLPVFCVEQRSAAITATRAIFQVGRLCAAHRIAVFQFAGCIKIRIHFCGYAIIQGPTDRINDVFARRSLPNKA